MVINMKNQTKVILIVSGIVLIVICLLANNDTEYKCKEIVDTNTNIPYLSIDNDSFPIINSESAELGLFTQNTVERINEIYLCDNNCISAKDDDIFIINKGFFQTKNYGYKKITENDYLYFQIEDNKILQYFACAGFELPELRAENIEQIRVEFIDYTSSKPNIIKERSIIEKIINNPVDYFENNKISDIYITYKNYDFEEWFDIHKLTQK